jgi:hypothetical protein
MAHPLRVTTPLLVAAALLAGCGGEPAPVTDKDAILRVTLTEYRIEPQNITVQATARPMKVHVVARNEGHLTHNLVIESIESAGEQGTGAQPIVFMKTDTAHPGETVSKTAFLQPGRYRLTCSIGNHDNLGQYGRLVVRAPKG